jgi:hypothetical protein
VTDDNIFREVDEEVRREQLKKLWERYQVLIVAAVMLVVIGVGGWRIYEWYQGKRADLFGTQFENAISLSEAGKHEEAEAIFGRIAREGTPAYQVIARVRQAAELAERDAPAAIALYRQIVDDDNVDVILRDLAAVRAASLMIDAGQYNDVRKLIEPIVQQRRDLRHTARELLALAAWKAGDRPLAMKWYAAILTDPEAPASSRTRVEILIALTAADGNS